MGKPLPLETAIKFFIASQLMLYIKLVLRKLIHFKNSCVNQRVKIQNTISYFLIRQQYKHILSLEEMTHLRLEEELWHVIMTFWWSLQMVTTFLVTTLKIENIPFTTLVLPVTFFIQLPKYTLWDFPTNREYPVGGILWSIGNTQ